MRRKEIHEWFFEIGPEFGRITGELAQSSPKFTRAKLWEPRVDILEDVDQFVLRAEIAGVKGDDIALIYVPERNSLVIKGVRWEEESPDRSVAHQLEIYYGEFEREIPLPEVPLLPEEIRGQYRNGFLVVVVPKA